MLDTIWRTSHPISTCKRRSFSVFGTFSALITSPTRRSSFATSSMVTISSEIGSITVSVISLPSAFAFASSQRFASVASRSSLCLSSILGNSGFTSPSSVFSNGTRASLIGWFSIKSVYPSISQSFWEDSGITGCITSAHALTIWRQFFKTFSAAGTSSFNSFHGAAFEI